MSAVRHFVIVLGDQLNRDAAVFDDFDPSRDVVWMAEVDNESTHVWTHKQRIVLFLSAMRHFRDTLIDHGLQVEYTTLESTREGDDLSTQLAKDLKRLKPDRVFITRPGEWRILKGLKDVCSDHGYTLQLIEDRHFFTTPDDFRGHAEGRKSLRMEFFYRELRKRFDILMEDGKPAGCGWNYDKENRGNFGKAGPDDMTPGPPDRSKNSITLDVIELVESRFPKHPGSLEKFIWAVTPEEARRDLEAFIKNRLPSFGKYQDAMWTNEPWLYHSWISSSLNLKLLDPREVISTAEAAYERGDAPLPAVEGFIRQILGWREYVRGIYWTQMPEYLEMNVLEAHEPLPEFYWTGDTELECLRQSIGQTLEHAYAHHIQRLMVTGLYALMLGVDPKKVHEWYLAVYIDAVEWVELPNSLGMSQYADGGLMASKPYIATGKYIDKMSNYCKSCPKNPAKRTGPDACPFTTLYWDFLMRHEFSLRANQRMSLQVRNLDRLDESDKSEIQKQAAAIRKSPNPAFVLGHE